ncbi:MAG TPA: tetratricopeptide repeat protein [Candidatus Deferrimicrobiaceae bacterium]|nr:tetratricopeptide repeat protein [Candidatus Deferrimicrobiaceae bacterium]
MRPTGEETNRLGRWLPSLAAALAFLAFLPALEATFVNWDDEASFLTNTAYRGLGSAELRWMFTTTFLGHWSPLTWITWSLNYVTGGLDPWGYHLGNLLLHSANVALLWLVARRLLAIGAGAPITSSVIASGATIATLVWGLHPLRAEAVAWASARRDVLCGLFYLLAVLAYLRGVAGGAGIERRWWGLSVGAFAAALSSKSIAMTLPLTLVLLDVYPLRRRGLGGWVLAREKLPYAMLAAAAGVVAFVARQESGNITAYAQYGVGARLALAAHTLWFSWWKSLWPAGLSPMYELPQRVDLGQVRFLGAVLAVAALTATLVLLRRRWPAGLAAWAQSVIVLVPISGVVHSGNQLAADRYSYLSGLGLAILAGAGLVWALRHAGGQPARRWIHPLAWVAAALVVVALGATARTQSAIWTDSETLWRRAVEVDPTCSLCESNLGRVVARPGRFAEAETHVRRAITLRPDRPGPHENMGMIMLAQSRHHEAEEHFRRAATLHPDRAASRNALGVALANQGRDREAEAEFQEAARLSPRLVDAPANLGVLYTRRGRFGEAIVPLRRALALDGGQAGLRAELGRALRGRAIELVREGRLGEAAPLWQEAAPLAGDDPDLLRSLGQALVEQGKGVEAIPILERAVTLAPQRGAERFWLARAYRLAGRIPEADRETATLRELAPAYAAELGR